MERNNDSGAKIYVDGQLQTTCDPTNHTASITSQTDLYLGYHRDSSSYYFDGTLDEISLFGRVLTANELLRLYSENLSLKIMEKDLLVIPERMVAAFMVDYRITVKQRVRIIGVYETHNFLTQILGVVDDR